MGTRLRLFTSTSAPFLCSTSKSTTPESSPKKMPNPLDLFSQSDAPMQYSSPVQETEKLKELRLERENKMLIEQRNQLRKEIEELEKQWEDHQAHDDMDAEEDENQEEDELIFNMLVQKAEHEMEILKKRQEQNGEYPTEDDDGKDLVEFDASKYSAKPLRDWPLRIEFLKKFYPYLSITKAKSRLTLESDIQQRSMLIKTISFTINYAQIFIFDVAVKLYSKEKTYHTWKLQITKLSNNKFNTILQKIAQHATETKNINYFLYTTNTLYELLITRQKTLTELYDEYPADPVLTPTIHTSQFKHRGITLTYDITFDDGELNPLVTVNGLFNSVFADMMDLYGVKRSVEELIKELYTNES